MRILSYDPGMVNIGYACVDYVDGVFSHRVHGLHVVPMNLPAGVRASQLMDFFELQMRELKPDVVVFEDNFGLPRKIMKGVGGTIALLNLACYYEDVPKVVPVSPAEWKKALTGAGKIDDAGLRWHINNYLPGVTLSEKGKAEHQNDALGIGIAYPFLPPISPRQNKAEKAMMRSFIAYDEVMKA